MLHSQLLRSIFLAGILLSFSMHSASGQIPGRMWFQGRLADSNGALLDTTVSMTFRMYKETTKIWQETQTDVEVTGGYFQVVLGAETPLDTVTFDQPVVIGIAVGDDEEIMPLVWVAPVPYALGLRNLKIKPETPQEGPNLIGGWSRNKAAHGVHGATISGGGDPDEPGFDGANEVNAHYGTIGGGAHNTVSGHLGTVGGGSQNRADSLLSVVSGGTNNHSMGQGSSIGGGMGNLVEGDLGTVSGGQENRAAGQWSTVAGGFSNHAIGEGATVGGGFANSSDSSYSAVAGGAGNFASGSTAAIGGGSSNSASGNGATVGGGFSNLASGSLSAVGGGTYNVSENLYSTVAGGNTNDAAGVGSTVGGGYGNEASGEGSTIPGGSLNEASGSYAFAAGLRSKARHTGSFVWADSSAGVEEFASTGENQFLIRAGGGVGINTNSPASNLHVGGATGWTGGLVVEADEGDRGFMYFSADAGLVMDTFRPSDSRRLPILLQVNGGNVGIHRADAGYPLHVGTDGTNGNSAHLTTGGTWISTSSRETKEDIRPVDADEILDRLAELPIQTWSYIGSDEGTHLGPMAEDFYNAFGFGKDDKGISMVDADGVALAAIQGLYKLITELQAENRRMRELIERIGSE